MKLYVTSDLHLEFGDLDLKNQHNIDVLILGGDICVAKDVGRESVQDFFARCSDRFPDTILIMGNLASGSVKWRGSAVTMPQRANISVTMFGWPSGWWPLTRGNPNGSWSDPTPTTRSPRSIRRKGKIARR